MKLFAALHYCHHKEPISFGHQVALESDSVEAAPPTRHILLVGHSVDTNQNRFSALLYQLESNTIVHIGLSHIVALHPRKMLPDDKLSDAKEALKVFNMTTAKAATEHSRRLVAAANKAAASKEAADKARKVAEDSKACTIGYYGALIEWPEDMSEDELEERAKCSQDLRLDNAAGSILVIGGIMKYSLT